MMNLLKPTLSCSLWIFLISLAVTPQVKADQKTVELGFGIPESCLGYFHAQRDGGWAELGAGLEKFGDGLKESSLLKMILTQMVTNPQSVKSPEEISEDVEEFEELLSELPWNDFIKSEVGIGIRFQYPRLDLIGLFRLEPKQRKKASGTLQEIFDAIASLEDDYQIEEIAHGGQVNVLIRSRRTPDVELCLATKDDLIILSTSGALVRESLQLLEGRSRGKSFLLSDVGKKKWAQADQQSHLQFYLAPSKYFEELQKVIDVLGSGEDDSPTALQAARLKHQLEHYVKSLNVLDSLSGSANLVNGKLESQFRVVLPSKDKRSGLANVFKGVEALKSLKSLLSEPAKPIILSSGFRINALIEEAIKILAGDAVETEAIQDAFNDYKKKNPEVNRSIDVLRLVDGPISLIGTSDDETDVLLTMGCSKVDKAKKAVEELAKALKPQALYSLAEAEVKGVRVYSINFPGGKAGKLHFASVANYIVAFDGEKPQWITNLDPLQSKKQNAKDHFLIKDAKNPKHLQVNLDIKSWIEMGKTMANQADALKKLLGQEKDKNEKNSIDWAKFLDSLSFLNSGSLSLSPSEGGLSGSAIIEFQGAKKSTQDF